MGAERMKPGGGSKEEGKGTPQILYFGVPGLDLGAAGLDLGV